MFVYINKLKLLIMKQHLQILTIVQIFLVTFISFSQTYKVDERRIYSWNNSAMPADWKHDVTEQYTYANGGIKETKTVGYSMPGMSLSYQHIKTYNTSNNITLNLKQIWNGSQWVDDSQDVYTYYSGTSNVKDMTTYSFSQGYDVYKVLYEYSGSDITKITFQDGSSGTLVNSEKFEYTYNSPGQPYQEFDSEWNGSSWDLIERTTATYVGGLRTELLVESYNGSTYDSFERYVSTYSGTLETEYLQQSWNGSSYVNSDRELSTYDGNDNKTVYIFESWIMNAWEPYYKEENDFSVAAPLGVNDFDDEKFVVFPNPVADIVNIKSTMAIDKIEIYNVIGKKVTQVNKTKRVDIKNLKSGIYFLKIFNKDKSTTKKIVVK